MSIWRIAVALLTLASTGVAQDLPPEVVLLSHIKIHMREELSRLPNYTCLETINRFHRTNANAAMKPLDTVRLEVIYSDHHEWYGSPGDRNLDVGNPSTFVGSGLMGTGAFATALNNILSGAHFVYQGKELQGGRTSVRYDFVFPRQANAFQISMVGGLGNVGEKGSIWFDEQSLDLIRFEAHADDIPAYLPLAEQETSASYARVQIGTGENKTSALLAQQADMRLVENAGVDNLDHLEFTNCRAYSTESTLSFGEGSAVLAAEPAKTAVPARSYSLPALLSVTIRLTTPISNSDPVGKVIEARVSGSVSYKGKVVIPDGASVRGRIRRLEHYQGTATDKGDAFGDYIVGLEFTEVEAAAGSAPFFADVLSMDKNPAIKPNLGERVSAGKVKITLPDLPGVASFFVQGAAFTVPAGFGTVWRTRGPIRGLESR